MEIKHTEITCSLCQLQVKVELGTLPNHWFVIKQVHDVQHGMRPYEWWFCSSKCACRFNEVFLSTTRDHEPTKVVPRKDITLLRCDVCMHERSSDARAVMIGSATFSGWFTSLRVRHDIHDNDPAQWHACSEECFKKLDLNKKIDWKSVSEEELGHGISFE